MTTFREGGYGAAEAAVEVKPYQIVKLDANDKVVLAAAGTDNIAGVVETGAKVGATAAYALRNGQGTFKVRLGGTVAKGANLTSDANGAAVTAVAGNVVFGTAVKAGVAGDVVEYLKADKVA